MTPLREDWTSTRALMERQLRGPEGIKEGRAKALATWIPATFGRPDALFASTPTKNSRRAIETLAPLAAAANVPVRMVHATRGKWVRAEPVAALYAQGRVHHAPGLTALEDEMCSFGADGMSDGHSPDRVDALVWAVTELMLRDGPRVRGM